MASSLPLPERPCTVCEALFLPKPSGYNARYCSARCRLTKQTKRVYKKRTNVPSRIGKQTYYDRVTKHDPERLKTHKASSNANKKALRVWLADYKTSRGCIDCGYNQHAAALQLDHTGPKIAAISELRSSIKRMLAEIEAGGCVVRCANCHAVKTWREKQPSTGMSVDVISSVTDSSTELLVRSRTVETS